MLAYIVIDVWYLQCLYGTGRVPLFFLFFAENGAVYFFPENNNGKQRGYIGGQPSVSA
jgi:hypothetical protein